MPRGRIQTRAATPCLAAWIAFLLLIYGSVHARRYGARGQGLGVFAFMVFFLAEFSEARVATLPLLGAAFSWFGCVAALYGRPGFLTAPRVLARLRRTVDARLRDVSRDVSRDVAALHVAGQDADRLVMSLARPLDRPHAAVPLIERLLGERRCSSPAG